MNLCCNRSGVGRSPGGLTGLATVGFADGRLTTESGVPISSSDRAEQGTIYYTPYEGNRLALFDGTNWQVVNFTEPSLVLVITENKNYDVFGVFVNATTMLLELSAAWTDDTTRATPLTLQDGVLVKSGDATRRYLGTIRAGAIANKTEDTRAKRFVWNYYNQVSRPLLFIDVTASWVLAASVVFSQRSLNQVEAVFGLTGFASTHIGVVVSTATAAFLGIGVDSTSVADADNQVAQVNGVGTLNTSLIKQMTLGYHKFVWLENAFGTAATFFGTGASPTRETAVMNGFVDA